MNEILSVAGVTSIIAVIVTLIFQYLPGLRVKWAGLETNLKMLVVLGLYIAFGAVVAFGGCVAFFAQFVPSLLCSDGVSFVQYVVAVMIAVGAGQGVFGLLPELQDVTITKAAR